MKTIRQRIIDCLYEGPLSGIEISQAVGIREKAVYEHLPHISQTVSAQKNKLILNPSQCLSCEYIFKKRERFARPSKCPICKGTYLQAPTYEIRKNE